MSIEVEIGPMSQAEFRRLFRYAEAVTSGERAQGKQDEPRRAVGERIAANGGTARGEEGWPEGVSVSRMPRASFLSVCRETTLRFVSPATTRLIWLLSMPFFSSVSSTSRDNVFTATLNTSFPFIRRAAISLFSRWRVDTPLDAYSNSR